MRRERIPEWLDQLHAEDDRIALAAAEQLRALGDAAHPFLIGRLRCRLTGRWPKLTEAFGWTERTAGILAAQFADIVQCGGYAAGVAADMLGRLGPAGDAYRPLLVRLDQRPRSSPGLRLRIPRSGDLTGRYDRARKQYRPPAALKQPAALKPPAPKPAATSIDWPPQWNGAPIQYLLAAREAGGDALPRATLELWLRSDPERQPALSPPQRQRLQRLRRAARALAASMPRLPLDALLALDPTSRELEIARIAVGVHRSGDAGLLANLERASGTDPIARAWVRLARLVDIEWQPRPPGSPDPANETGIAVSGEQSRDSRFASVQRAIDAADRLGRWSFEAKARAILTKGETGVNFTLQKLRYRTDWSEQTLDAVAEVALLAAEGQPLLDAARILVDGGEVGARHLEAIDFDAMPRSRALTFLRAGCLRKDLLRSVLLHAAGDLTRPQQTNIRDAISTDYRLAERGAAIGKLLESPENGARVLIGLRRVWRWSGEPAPTEWVQPIEKLLADKGLAERSVRAAFDILARSGRIGAERIAEAVTRPGARLSLAIAAVRKVPAAHAEICQEALLTGLRQSSDSTLPELVGSLMHVSSTIGRQNPAWQRRLLTVLEAEWSPSAVPRRAALAMALHCCAPLLADPTAPPDQLDRWVSRLRPLQDDSDQGEVIRRCFARREKVRVEQAIGALLLRLAPSRAEFLAYWRSQLDPQRPEQERAAALRALADARESAATLIDELIEALSTESRVVRFTTIWTLRRMGNAALPTLPKLRQLAKSDPDRGIRFNAERAVAAMETLRK